jgi:glycogen debranching enzyme
MKLANVRPSSLVASAERGYMSLFELTNPDLRMENGTLIQKENIGIEWERVLDSKKHVLSDLITFENFNHEKAAFPISFQFRAEFEDVFAVRGLLPKKLGKLQPSKWEGGALNFMYDGADGLYRSVSIYFSETPRSTDDNTAHFDISLEPRERKQLLISVSISETKNKDDAQPRTKFHPDLKGAAKQFDLSADKWMGDQTTVTTDSLLVNSVLDRSLRDLHVLRSDLDGESYFAAGLPWFGTLFGRDSLITSLQTLAFRSEIAEQTLRLLAKYQGTKVDDYRDEQPGKILHELRVGEMARLDEIPQSPYYGSIDATILFLILIGEHAAWTGDLKVFTDLKDNVDQALNWMRE